MADSIRMTIVLLLVLITSYKMGFLHAQDLPILTPHYYEKSCPCAFPIIRNEMHLALLKEPRMAASLLRLQFHDCFVQGCDASLLLDDTSTFRGEKTANANMNSARGFDVIDLIKTKVESQCPGVVSCADIITIAARDAVLLSGGPYWDVSLGRKDSRTASSNDANNNIPTPNSNLPTLITSFQRQGLSIVDMVALLGGHTIGNARCQNIRPRIYNNSLNMAFPEPHLSLVKAACPQSGNDNGVWPLDFPTPILFDNSYYINIVRGLGLLNSDQTLYSEGSETKEIVESYAHDPLAFWRQFAESMAKMSNIVDPITFVTGEVRKNCRTVNDPF